MSATSFPLRLELNILKDLFHEFFWLVPALAFNSTILKDTPYLRRGPISRHYYVGWCSINLPQSLTVRCAMVMLVLAGLCNPTLP